MSEELKKGIPKAVQTGEKIVFTEEEQRKHNKDFEGILKSIGVLKKSDKIEDFKI